MATNSLYRLHELTIQTLYAEVKERSRIAGQLLVGTPGTLVKREGTGHAYWYRSFYPHPKKRCEQFVGPEGNEAAYEAMVHRIEFAVWTTKQVSTLSKLGYQVADKGVASVLVELHNKGLFEAGLSLVGTLAYMGWLNEYGAMAIAARTQDIDLARRRALKLAASVPFLSTLQATQLPFTRVPGMPSRNPSTSMKLPGAAGLRVDILAPGRTLGDIVALPELHCHAQTVPFYDYLLEDSRPTAMLAGGHCIPVRLPHVPRMIWHKIYSSMHRKSEPAKAQKDLLQAATLAAIMIEQDNVPLSESFEAAPRKLRSAALAQRPRLDALLLAHPQARDAFRKLSAD